nr:protein memo1 [Hymenolepis microstoma]
MSVRRASHKNSWYSGNRDELEQQISEWLSKASYTQGPARAIITPNRIFVLGPSHHFYLDNCAISDADIFETPFYNMHIDANVRKELLASKMFMNLDVRRDEDEHSLEMQYPYLAKVMESRANNFTIVPIVVGSLSFSNEQAFGELMAPYLADPSNLFVISSDFCHWGSRFRYTYYDKSAGEIWESIKDLDHKGMSLIENLDTKGFNDYLHEYGNTICGRHPIGVLLQAINALKKSDNSLNPSLKFVQYAQSSKCRNGRDSSVSYAAASLVFN